MAKRSVGEDDLRERITAAMLADVGISERMAKPLVDAVMDCLAGEQLYFPARKRKREYPLDAMRQMLLGGAAVKHVLREFEISRSKLHSLFPGGLPRPERTTRAMRA